MLATAPDRYHFWQAFVAMADAISQEAGMPEDVQFVARRLNEILAWHDLEGVDRDS